MTCPAVAGPSLAAHFWARLEGYALSACLTTIFKRFRTLMPA